MTPLQIESVQRSWAKIETRREAAAAVFYERLFALAPALRPMFKGDLQAQGAKLMATLHVVVANLEHLEPLLPPVKQLALRHVDWGVRPEHYDLVGEALMQTLDLGSGQDAASIELREAWRVAYAALADAMKATAYPEG